MKTKRKWSEVSVSVVAAVVILMTLDCYTQVSAILILLRHSYLFIVNLIPSELFNITCHFRWAVHVTSV